MEQADHQSNNAQASSSSSRLDAIKRLLAEKFKFTETRGIGHAAELERYHISCGDSCFRC
ncbi:MAG: hypothetical protein VXY77_01570 [Pseudomonadota bacterium]|nr:hypothetical protein [Pseudomonadota bacterium]